MKIQWYPGHMTKAKRAMEEDIKLVDIIIEIIDSRLPVSSRNPDIDKLGKNKIRVLLMNKSDLSDERANQIWKKYYTEKGYFVLPLDARTTGSMKQVQALVQDSCREKVERDRQRGIKNRPIRVMVVGIPNVGKSTFINSFAKRAVAKTGNRPGVTKGNQWIRLSQSMELLDTPGILWPKFEDVSVGEKLALVGSVNDEVLDLGELACTGIEYMRKLYPDVLRERYEFTEEMQNYEVLENIARLRGCLKKGGQFDYDKAARLFLDDLRSGKLGRITLELPDRKDEQ